MGGSVEKYNPVTYPFKLGKDVGNSLNKNWDDISGKTAKKKAEQAALQAQRDQQAIIDQQTAAEKAVGPKPTIDTVTDLESQRRKRLNALRFGILSTIKTSPMGLTGTSTVNIPAAFAAGMKSKLGQ